MKSVLPLAMAWLALLFPAMDALASQRVLLLNSYHKGYNWTDQQSDAIEAELRANSPDVDIDVVYMDWKRYPDPEQPLNVKRMLAGKYAGKPPDLIVTTDDAALIFSLKYKAEILGDPPVVFTGVFRRTAEELTAGRRDTTGVYEFLDPSPTIDLAGLLNPRLRHLYILHDSSETSLSLEREITESVAKRYPTLTVDVLSDAPFSEIKRRAATLPANSAVLHASYARDSEGLIRSPEAFAKEISEVSSAPVYTFYTHLLDSGVVGGGVLDGRLEGKATGRVALSVLAGTPPSELVPTDQGSVRRVVVHKVATDLGLPTEGLPEDVEIVGRPFSFFETYRDLVFGRRSRLHDNDRHADLSRDKCRSKAARAARASDEYIKSKEKSTRSRE